MIKVEKKHSNILALVHIEKAAGTSLIHILRRNFLFQYCDARPLSKGSDGVFRSVDMDKLNSVIRPVCAIGGHSIYPYSELATAYKNMQFITLLRDPVKRYISQYRHISERKSRTIRFEDFLETEGVANFQTKKIAGEANSEKAKEILTEKFLLVGVVEQFDQFLVLLRREIDDKTFDPRYEQKNVVQNRVKSDEIYEMYYESIVERNREDIAIYDYVRDVLIPNKVTLYGSDFDNDLNKFKRDNSLTFGNYIGQYCDFAFRKAYIEPITGVIRRINGMPGVGSYGRFYHPDSQPW